MNADRNLLFGVLALQLNLVTQSQLAAGMHAWVADKQASLAAHLIRLGHLAAESAALLDPLVARHIVEHNNDPAQSLAAISSVTPIASALAPLAREDHEVADSIGCFKPALLQMTKPVPSARP